MATNTIPLYIPEKQDKHRRTATEDSGNREHPRNSVTDRESNENQRQITQKNGHLENTDQNELRWEPQQNKEPPTGTRATDTNKGKTRIRHSIRRKNHRRIRKNLNIWYSNINGIISKQNHLQVLLAADQPHIVIITETKTQSLPNIRGYTWVAQHKPNRAGGVAIAARKDIAHNITETETERIEGMEIAWAELKTKTENVYIAAYYGKQESEMKEIVENEYSLLTTNTIRYLKKGHVIIAGDFNAKLNVKSKEKTVQEQSANGKIMQQMINTTGLTPVTTEPDIGTWTRVNRNKTEERSIIDYFLVDKQIQKHIETVEIDEQGVRRPKGVHETDHNTIIMNMKIIQTKKISQR